MGSIYHIKDSRFWWISYKGVDGRRHAESSRSERRSDAARLLREREGRIVRGEPVTPKVAKTTFSEAAEDVLNDFRINGKRSLDEVARRIKKHLSPFFGAYRLSDITTPDVRAYIAKRQNDSIITAKERRHRDADGNEIVSPEVRRRVSNAEINRELQVLKRMFNLAIQAGKAIHKPYVPMLKESSPRKGFVEHAQLEAVLAHMPVDLQRVICFAFLTGWRLYSEVLSLEWRQVDWEADEVRLDPGHTKNGEGRTFRMTRKLRSVLVDCRTATEQIQRERTCVVPYVFHRAGLRIKSITKAWQAACRQAGYPGLIPHDLRRSAVRNFVRAGVPERVAMQLTGHKTRSVFERYNIVSDSDLTAAAARLDAMSEQRFGSAGGQVLAMEVAPHRE